MPDTVTIELCGETLQLLPERAVFWQRRETLFVADTHLGNSERMHAPADMPAEGNTLIDLERLDRTLERTGAHTLVVLGDLIHARGGRNPDTLGLLHEWRTAHTDLKVLLVRGNHDRVTGDPPSELRITCVDEPYPFKPFMLRHYPVPSNGCVTLAGHLHPTIRYTDRTVAWQALPSFILREKVLVLPAFGSFLRQPSLMPMRSETAYMIHDNRVHSYGGT